MQNQENFDRGAVIQGWLGAWKFTLISFLAAFLMALAATCLPSLASWPLGARAALYLAALLASALAELAFLRAGRRRRAGYLSCPVSLCGSLCAWTGLGVAWICGAAVLLLGIQAGAGLLAARRTGRFTGWNPLLYYSMSLDLIVVLRSVLRAL